LIIGIRILFAISPDNPLHGSVLYPSFFAVASTIAKVSAEVAMPADHPRQVSITGTGFMKCIPMNLSGAFVAAASFVIEIERSIRSVNRIFFLNAVDVIDDFEF